jgi:hypothetical protein
MGVEHDLATGFSKAGLDSSPKLAVVCVTNRSDPRILAAEATEDVRSRVGRGIINDQYLEIHDLAACHQILADFHSGTN